jgi:ring-1,2-phenylacetyl-CoA epoxidase subunit PaaE
MPKFNELTVKDIRRETDDCVSIAFDVPAYLLEAYHYTQGQYLTVKKDINGEEIRRSYSICTSPAEGELRVAVKKVPGGRFSTFANEELQIGDRLEVMTPMGRFFTTLSTEHENDYVAFAAGSGITPIMSIMKTVLLKEPKSSFTLFYGNRATDSIIFREQIEALKNTFMGRLSVHHILSREQQDSDLFNGRIDGQKCAEFCKRFFDPTSVDAYFLCGPFSMIESVKEQLIGQGVKKEKIHFELFTTDAVPKVNKKIKEETALKAEDIEAMITLTLDGSSFEFPLSSKGDTILDAALKAGADLPFSCKGGVCSTCRAKVVSGEVNMDVNYALEEEEVEQGYVLTCQSHPRTDSVHVDFDS